MVGVTDFTYEKRDQDSKRGKKDPTALLVLKYRRMFNDYYTPEREVAKKVEYIRSLCKKIIKIEFPNYVKTQKLSASKSIKGQAGASLCEGVEQETGN